MASPWNSLQVATPAVAALSDRFRADLYVTHEQAVLTSQSWPQ